MHRLVAWRGCSRSRSRSGMSSRDTSIEASVRKSASCRSRPAGRRVRGESRSSVAASRKVVKRANQSQTEVSAVRASAQAAPVTPVSGAVSSSCRFGSASSSSRLAPTASAALRYRASSRSMAARSRSVIGTSRSGPSSAHRVPSHWAYSWWSEPSARIVRQHAVDEPHEVVVAPLHRDRVGLELGRGRGQPELAGLGNDLLALEAAQDRVVAGDGVDGPFLQCKRGSLSAAATGYSFAVGTSLAILRIDVEPLVAQTLRPARSWSEWMSEYLSTRTSWCAS